MPAAKPRAASRRAGRRGSREPNTFERLTRWARSLRRDAHALWLAARDPRVSRGAKLLAGAVAAYALSPIDLIPDFVPVIGYLDDLIIVPAGIWLVLRLIPDELVAELRERAAREAARPVSRVAAAAIVALWLTAAGLAFAAVSR